MISRTSFDDPCRFLPPLRKQQHSERPLFDPLALTTSTGILGLLALSHCLEDQCQVVLIVFYIDVVNIDAIICFAGWCRQQGADVLDHRFELWDALAYICTVCFALGRL